MKRFVILGATLAACSSSASLTGEIGGEPVESPRDAAYDTVIGEFPLVGPVQVFTLMISDAPDVCTTFRDFEDNLEIGCEEQCEDWGRIANEQLGKDAYYTLELLAVVDPDRVEGGLRLGGGLLPAENEFKGELTTYDMSNLYDEEGCNIWCEARNPLIPTETTRLTAGELELLGYETSDSLEGSFGLTLGEDSLEGSFKADYCDGLPGLP